MLPGAMHMSPHIIKTENNQWLNDNLNVMLRGSIGIHRLVRRP